MDYPKYKIGTLLLSNHPYNIPDGRQEIGHIIYVYEQNVFIKKPYVVEWSGRNVPYTYNEQEIYIFIENLKKYMELH